MPVSLTIPASIRIKQEIIDADVQTELAYPSTTMQFEEVGTTTEYGRNTRVLLSAHYNGKEINDIAYYYDRITFEEAFGGISRPIEIDGAYTKQDLIDLILAQHNVALEDRDFDYVDNDGEIVLTASPMSLGFIGTVSFLYQSQMTFRVLRTNDERLVKVGGKYLRVR